MNKNLFIGNKKVGTGKDCYIIAEAGVNHNGDMTLAKKLVDAAKEAGADAVKFQTYKAEDLVTVEADQAEYQKENIGKSETQFEMLKRLELKEEDFKVLKDYCDGKEITFMSTPHTESSIDVLKDLMPAFKVGSGDLTNIPFLEKLATYKKPILLSTGMGTMDETKEALQAIYDKGNKDVVIFHCTTNYPCPKKDVNLRVIQTMQKELDCVIGYSDHTEGIDVTLMAVQLGAKVIEKHFTLDKEMEGPDHKASMNPEELKELVKRVRSQESIELDEEVMGSPIKNPTKKEKEIMKVIRKSIVTKRSIEAGEILGEDNLVIKRPGIGIEPKYWSKLIGKEAKKNLKSDYLLRMEDVK